LVNVVKEKFPHASCYPEYQMYAAKGEEHVVSPNFAQRLKPQHVSLLAQLYLTGESQFHKSEETCKKLLKKRGVYGVFQNGKLVSVAVAVPLLPEIGEIRGVLTRPNYRNKGFGTMATSAATKHILERADGANLYVAADNKAAIRVYEKLSYKKIDEWFWVDIGTGLKP
jgi:predicted GNAT family acetyltransferase